MLGNGAADVMTYHGNRLRDLQRTHEPPYPFRESRDRSRCRREFASRTPKSGKVDGNRPQPCFPELAYHRKPYAAPVRPVEQQQDRTILSSGEIACRFAVDPDRIPGDVRFIGSAH